MRFIFLAPVLALGLALAACGGDSQPPSPQPTSTARFDSPLPLLTPETEAASGGNGAVPAVIRALQAHDLAALGQHVLPGRPLVRESCDGAPTSAGEPFADAARRALGDSPSSSVYAVMKGSGYSARPELASGYIVALVPGTSPSADIAGSFWYLDADGNIAGIRSGCGESQPLALVLSSSYPKSEYLLKAN